MAYILNKSAALMRYCADLDLSIDVAWRTAPASLHAVGRLIRSLLTPDSADNPVLLSTGVHQALAISRWMGLRLTHNVTAMAAEERPLQVQLVESPEERQVRRALRPRLVTVGRAGGRVRMLWVDTSAPFIDEPALFENVDFHIQLIDLLC